jgi:hypothetical protein
MKPETPDADVDTLPVEQHRDYVAGCCVKQLGLSRADAETRVAAMSDEKVAAIRDAGRHAQVARVRELLAEADAEKGGKKK